MCAVDELMNRVLAATQVTGPFVVGLAGPPGSGKTTLAETLTTALRVRLGDVAVAQVPMDGFHLADVELARLGLSGRKGAQETFDAAGYAELLARIRRGSADIVYAPSFGRDLEQPIAGAIPVHPGVQVVITEGNYLLLDLPQWRAVATHIDEIWYCATESNTRVGRLVNRHVHFGKSPGAAQRWVAEVDEPNARLIESAAHRADVTVDMSRIGF